MLPFVQPGDRTNTATALDPSISPILTNVDEAVCWWWRWKKLKLQLFDIESFGDQELELTRYVAPYSVFGGNTPVDSEKLLAKKESHVFAGELTIFGAQILGVTAEVKIMPPEGTVYGTGGDGGVVGDSYQIEEATHPSICDCVPIVIIDINVDVQSGTDFASHLKNYGTADNVYGGEFGGVYGGVVGEVVSPHAITLNSAGTTTAFIPAATTVAKIFPVEWFSWNGTWNTDTGERL